MVQQPMANAGSSRRAVMAPAGTVILLAWYAVGYVGFRRAFVRGYVPQHVWNGSQPLFAPLFLYASSDLPCASQYRTFVVWGTSGRMSWEEAQRFVNPIERRRRENEAERARIRAALRVKNHRMSDRRKATRLPIVRRTVAVLAGVVLLGCVYVNVFWLACWADSRGVPCLSGRIWNGLPFFEPLHEYGRSDLPGGLRFQAVTVWILNGRRDSIADNYEFCVHS